MTSSKFSMIPVLGTLLAGCALQPGDSQGDEASAEQTAQAVMSAPAAAAEDFVLEPPARDGRVAAAAEAKVLGAPAIVAPSLVSSWFSGSVAPGGAQHWFWNNSSLTVAYKVGLSPIGASTTSPCQFQVTRAWDVQQNTGEREFHFLIQNTGSITCGTTILLASQTRSATWSTGGIGAGASQGWTWNNANPLTASHLVGISPTGSTATDTCQIQVTRNWYSELPTGERKFNFTLQNVGAIACQGDVQLAQTTAADSSWSTGVISPGASQGWVWNNANPINRVYVPGLSPTGATAAGNCQLEITQSSYQQLINADGTAQRRFFFTIKNVGSISCSGTVLLNNLG